MSKKVVVRAAPSPTSPYGLHVGNIRTILYNYLFAKQNDGIFYVRIEDTDQGRFCPGAEELIKNSLEWLGMKPDFAPWTDHPFGSMRQSERDYSKYIQHLLDTGKAYYAFDTPDEIEALRKEDANFTYNYATRDRLKNSLTMSSEEVKALLDKKTPYVVRFKVIPNTIIKHNDIIRGEVEFNSNQMDDKVLLKSNGIGSYHLCNVCDDHDMGTTHVIRGEEWLSSVPIHIMLYEAFGWEVPQFAHLPLVLNPPPMKGKLSKRNAVNMGIPIFPFGGDGVDEKGNKFTLKGYVDEGYGSDALINFLLFLGWTPEHKDFNEIMSMEDAIREFDLFKVHKNGARYDPEKLKWFNGWYVQNNISNEELLGSVNFGHTNFSHDDKLAIIDMAKKRSHFRHDLQTVVDLFVKPVTLSDKQQASIGAIGHDNDATKPYREALAHFINEIGNTSWDHDGISKAIETSCEKTGVKKGKIMPVLRTVVAAGVAGPDMLSMMTLLSKEEVVGRIISGLNMPEFQS
jgi:glutamyl-tRNA synthetase